MSDTIIKKVKDSIEKNPQIWGSRPIGRLRKSSKHSREIEERTEKFDAVQRLLKKEAMDRFGKN